MKKILPYCFLASILVPSSLLHAAEFAPVFVSGAVLQRDMPVEVWGKGRDGEAVTVEIAGQSKTATTKDRSWTVTFDPMPAGEGLTLRLHGDNEKALSNIAVGEVWICSGQSNMEWRLNGCAPLYDNIIASADDPDLRELKIPLRAYAGDPLPPLTWKEFKPNTAGQFSAIPYFFAAELRKKLNVPVGIINCAFGGTPIEAWMTRESILAAGGQKTLEADERKAAAFATPEDYEKAWNEYQQAKKDWDGRKKSGASAAEVGPEPKEPYGYRSKSRPTALHGTMLGVIRPYTARGVLWYQGENNFGNLQYDSLLTQLIATFRQEWKRPEWPFFIAQLSTPNAFGHPDNAEDYPIVREAQRKVATGTPNSGFIVTLDHGEKGNVHPKQKQPVGERFARLALARVYGQTGLAAQSPHASRAKADRATITIDFANLPGSLETRDPALPTLEVQDAASGAWKPAGGDISADGKTLRVSLPEGTNTAKAVRYAWRNYCVLSLYTDEDLPVSPWSLEVK